MVARARRAWEAKARRSVRAAPSGPSGHLPRNNGGGNQKRSSSFLPRCDGGGPALPKRQRMAGRGGGIRGSPCMRRKRNSRAPPRTLVPGIFFQDHAREAL
jgi:hypothetical protein